MQNFLSCGFLSCFIILWGFQGFVQASTHVVLSSGILSQKQIPALSAGDTLKIQTMNGLALTTQINLSPDNLTLLLDMDNDADGVGTLSGTGSFVFQGKNASIRLYVQKAPYNQLKSGNPFPSDSYFTTGGSGTIQSLQKFLLVSTPAHWKELALAMDSNETFLASENKGYALSQDIDLGTIAPFGDSVFFNGLLDGRGYTLIYNHQSSNKGFGLFRKIRHARIKNLSIQSTLTGDKKLGALASTCDSSFLQNIRVQSSITGNDSIGGICAIMEACSLSTVSFSGSIDAPTSEKVGGIAYSAAFSELNNLTNYGDINATKAYGLVGAFNISTIKNSANYGTIKGSAVASGIIGTCTISSGSELTNYGTIESQSQASGIFDLIQGIMMPCTITRAWNYGSVKGDIVAGIGRKGWASYSGNSASLTGTSSAHGILATAISDVKYNLNFGVINGSNYAAGILGSIFGAMRGEYNHLENNQNVASVTGSTSYGIGYNIADASVKDNFNSAPISSGYAIHAYIPHSVFNTNESEGNIYNTDLSSSCGTPSTAPDVACAGIPLQTSQLVYLDDPALGISWGVTDSSRWGYPGIDSLRSIGVYHKLRQDAILWNNPDSVVTLDLKSYLPVNDQVWTFSVTSRQKVFRTSHKGSHVTFEQDTLQKGSDTLIFSATLASLVVNISLTDSLILHANQIRKTSPHLTKTLDTLQVNTNTGKTSFTLTDEFSDSDGDALTFSVANGTKLKASISDKKIALTWTESPASRLDSIIITATDIDQKTAQGTLYCFFNASPESQYTDTVKLAAQDTVSLDPFDLVTDPDGDNLTFLLLQDKDTIFLQEDSLKLTHQNGVGLDSIPIRVTDSYGDSTDFILYYFQQFTGFSQLQSNYKIASKDSIKISLPAYANLTYSWSSQNSNGTDLSGIVHEGSKAEELWVHSLDENYMFYLYASLNGEKLDSAKMIILTGTVSALAQNTTTLQSVRIGQQWILSGINQNCDVKIYNGQGKLIQQHHIPAALASYAITLPSEKSLYAEIRTSGQILRLKP